MKAFRILCLVVAALIAWPVSAQDKPADPASTKKEVKPSGFLPMNWKKLGLSAEQIDKIKMIQNKYKEQIDELQAKIKELQDKRDKERLDVLTPEQKKLLEKILKGKAGG